MERKRKLLVRPSRARRRTLKSHDFPRINDQPTVTAHHGWSSTSNFQPFPRCHRGGQPVMRAKVTEVIRLAGLYSRRAVGNPNALSKKIHRALGRVARRFLRTSSGKEGSVQDGQCRLSRWIGNRDGEYAGILIVHVIEIDAVIRAKPGEPQTAPVEQVLRYSEGDSGSFARQRGVSHHVAAERLDERDARVLTTTSAVRKPLVIGFRFQSKAKSLDACRLTGLIKSNPGDTDP